MNLICLFTTGRTGTALLTQLFSGEIWEKRKIVKKDRNIFLHEALETKNLKIPDLKKLDMFSEESIKLQKSIMKREILKLCKNNEIQNVFITDHRIGRYFIPGLSQLRLIELKVIYLHRNEKDVVSSFLKKLKTKRLDKYKQRKLIQLVCDKNIYTPLDKSSINKISEAEWNNYNYELKLKWYVDEVKIKWEEIKKRILLDYIEVNTENLENEDLDKISRFIDIPCHKQLLSIKVNKNE